MRVSDSYSFTEALLTEAHVAVVPGADFGGCGNNHIRISFACAQKQIDDGMTRLARFTASLR
jgi:aminotransferase